MRYSEVPLADGMVLVHPASLGLMTIDLMARHGLMTIDLMADGSGSPGPSFLTVDLITLVNTSIQTIIPFKHRC